MNHDSHEPLAFFFTWTTYGVWLPGDSRGWIERGEGHREPSPVRETDARTRMTELPCLLSPEQRTAVEEQVAETCQYRHWLLREVNCRSNHIHVIVSAADTDPKKIRKDLKAWTTRRLKRISLIPRKNWWEERGSIRWLFDEQSVDRALLYVREAQDRKARDQHS